MKTRLRVNSTVFRLGFFERFKFKGSVVNNTNIFWIKYGILKISDAVFSRDYYLGKVLKCVVDYLASGFFFNVNLYVVFLRDYRFIDYMTLDFIQHIPLYFTMYNEVCLSTGILNFYRQVFLTRQVKIRMGVNAVFSLHDLFFSVVFRDFYLFWYIRDVLQIYYFKPFIASSGKYRNFFNDIFNVVNFITTYPDLTLFTWYFSKIFRFLPKHEHMSFLSFVYDVFSFFLLCKENVCGVSLIFSGKIAGKLRAKSVIWKSGRLFLKTVEEFVLYDSAHVRNRYGTYGLKLWIFYKDVSEISLTDFNILNFSSLMDSND